jgi:hypothetical protein
MQSNLERAFLIYWRMLGNGIEPEREYEFHPVRRWRFDVAWPEHLVAVELQGATWAQGRHTRGQGYRNDCEKAIEAQLLGWTVLWVTRDMLEDDPALIMAWVKQAMEEGV